MLNPPSEELLGEAQALLGSAGFSRDPADLSPWLTDWRGRYRGNAAALQSPSCTSEAQQVVARCTAGPDPGGFGERQRTRRRSRRGAQPGP